MLANIGCNMTPSFLQTGAEMMSMVPRTVEEVEAWMAGDDSFMARWNK